MDAVRVFYGLQNDMVELVDTYHMEEDISKFAGVSHESKEGPTVEKLLQWGHLSPFEFAEATFYIEAPIFVVRQWFRHRTGTYMEKSGRYTQLQECFIPEGVDERIYLESLVHSIQKYQELLDGGAKREVARAVLPVGMMTKFYFKMDLRNLLNFFKLRLDNHAQKEIRWYARRMLDLLEPYYPVYCDYVKSNYIKE